LFFDATLKLSELNALGLNYSANGSAPAPALSVARLGGGPVIFVPRGRQRAIAFWAKVVCQ